MVTRFKSVPGPRLELGEDAELFAVKPDGTRVPAINLVTLATDMLGESPTGALN